MSQELITTATNGQQQFMPALSVTEAVQRRVAIVDFVREAMVAGVDFGCIPGTPKPTLLKPGAEKLCTLFGLTTRFQIIHSVEDWMGQSHGSEPFFYYLYRCQLWRDAFVIAEGDGSCNSWEQKYRWRDAQRACPHCGKAAIIKGRAEYGGGWLCFAKKGGCGAKFGDGDAAIETQTVGRIPSPDVADQVNTIQKMAQKRALIAATLLAVNASEFFTQDEEERIGPEAQTIAAQTIAAPIEQAAPTAGEQENAVRKAEEPPLVVVEFTAPRSVPPEPSVVPAPPLTLASHLPSASEARAAFERKAREQWNFEGKEGNKEMALLAVALLGGKPERWTAQAWQQAADQPDVVWRDALASLNVRAV